MVKKKTKWETDDGKIYKRKLVTNVYREKGDGHWEHRITLETHEILKAWLSTVIDEANGNIPDLLIKQEYMLVTK